MWSNCLAESRSASSSSHETTRKRSSGRRSPVPEEKREPQGAQGSRGGTRETEHFRCSRVIAKGSGLCHPANHAEKADSACCRTLDRCGRECRSSQNARHRLREMDVREMARCNRKEVASGHFTDIHFP